MVRTVLIYGLALAVAAAALQWLEYQVWARAHASSITIALIATAFMALGVWVGARLFRPKAEAGPFEPNTRAQASLGISARECEVLRLLVGATGSVEHTRCEGRGEGSCEWRADWRGADRANTE